MAQRLQDRGSTLLKGVPMLRLDQHGRLSGGMVFALRDFLAEVYARLNGNVSMGTGTTGHRSGNMDGEYIDVVTPAVANTEYTVKHNLNRTPFGVIAVQRDVAGSVYSNDLGSWTAAQIILYDSAASATLKLWIF